MARAFPFSILSIAVFVALAPPALAWPTAQAPAIPEATGYVPIPNVPFKPDAKTKLRVVFDATLPSGTPDALLPALDMVGSEVNALAVEGAPLSQNKFVVVFHGPSVNGILDDAHYRKRFNVANPNLAVLKKLREQGVALYVCGQHLAAQEIDPSTLSPDVTVASDALLVLITLQNQGYALLSF